MRRVRMGVVLIALLGVASAGAVEVPYHNSPVGNIDAAAWNSASDVKVVVDTTTPTTADIVVNVTDITTPTSITGDIIITADDAFSASLKFSGTPTVDTLGVGGNITLSGTTDKAAQLELGNNYKINVSNNIDIGVNSTLKIGGTLNAVSSVTNITNIVGGSLEIDATGKASLGTVTFTGGQGTIAGELSAATININTGSTVVVSGDITENGMAATNVLNVASGTLNVSAGGTVDFKTIKAATGIIDVAGTGEITATSLDASGASQITFDDDSTINIATLDAKGTSRVFIDGTVTNGNNIIASGNSEVQFQSNMKIAGTGSLGELKVADNATVDINAAVTSDALTFTGGTINLKSSTLKVSGPLAASGISGTLNYNGAGAKTTFTGNVVFSGGGIFVDSKATNAQLTTTGGLEIGAGATLDTSAGAFSATINGDFTLNGTLKVGYATSGVILADITDVDDLVVDQNAKIEMSDDLVRHIATITDLQTDSVQVLKTNNTANGSGTLSWNSGVVTYDYTVRNDGIWVTGSRSIGRDQIRDNMLAQWGAFPQIGEDVGTVLPDDFIDAVIDASYLVRGPGYANLSVSGQFNADVLSSLVNPEAAPYAGYDALMLYNGSGLAMASQVSLSSNAKILRYIARRTENLRREIRGNDLVDPDSYAPAPLPASRVWAEALYHVDNAKEAKGFAGYEYYGSGVIVGYDQLFGDLAIGGAASFLGGEYKDHTALAYDSRIDTYGLDLYATLTAPSGWFASLTAGYGYTDNRLRDYRFLKGVGGWNSGDFAGHTLKISASFGRDYWIGDYLTLSPSAGFEYAGSRLEAHRQYFLGDNQTVGADTLAAGEVKNHSSRVPITLAASYNILGDDDSLLTLTGNVGYAYELHDEGASGSIGYEGLGGLVGPVRAVRRDVGRHAFMAGVRGQYYYRQYEFGFGYEYYARRSNHLHSFWLNGGLSF